MLDVCHCPPASNKPRESSNLRVSGSSSQLIEAVGGKAGDDEARLAGVTLVEERLTFAAISWKIM